MNNNSDSLPSFLSGNTIQDFLLGNVGAPFIIGFAVGYFAKKTLKFALLLAGLAIIIMFVTEYYGFTHVSDEGLKNATSVVVNGMKTFADFLLNRLSQITSRGLSAVAGFATGLKFG